MSSTKIKYRRFWLNLAGSKDGVLREVEMGRVPKLMSLLASIMCLIVAMRDMISFSKNKALKPSNSEWYLTPFPCSFTCFWIYSLPERPAIYFPTSAKSGTAVLTLLRLHMKIGLQL